MIRSTQAPDATLRPGAWPPLQRRGQSNYLLLVAETIEGGGECVGMLRSCARVNDRMIFSLIGCHASWGSPDKVQLGNGGATTLIKTRQSDWIFSAVLLWLLDIGI